MSEHEAANTAPGVIRFLLGEARLDGYSFGDVPPGEGRYWWRTALIKAWNARAAMRPPLVPGLEQAVNDFKRLGIGHTPISTIHKLAKGAEAYIALTAAAEATGTEADDASER